MAENIHREESYKIMGESFEVYKQMGRGFLEAVYPACLEVELAEREIPFAAQHQLYFAPHYWSVLKADIRIYFSPVDNSRSSVVP